MDWNHEILENANIVSGFVPIDMSSGANNGNWVRMSEYQKLLGILFKAAGGAGGPPTFTVQQATSSAGAGAKALNFTRQRVKDGASLASIGVDTLTTVAATNTVTPAAGNTQTIIAVEINGTDLDVANGFQWVQINVPQVTGGAQLGALLYFMANPRHPQSIPLSPFVA